MSRLATILGPLADRATVVGDYWFAGGWPMVPLAIIAFLIWYRYLAMHAQLREALGPAAVDAAAVEHGLRALPPAADPEAWLGATPGAAARLLRHVLARLRAGLSIGEALAQCRQAELAPYGHAFYVLGALVVAAPLLGLLGTVLGMVATFDAVTVHSGEPADLMAAGISQALITTQVGLIAALPGTFGLAHLYRLYRRLATDLDRAASYLVLLAAEDPERFGGGR